MELSNLEKNIIWRALAEWHDIQSKIYTTEVIRHGIDNAKYQAGIVAEIHDVMKKFN